MSPADPSDFGNKKFDLHEPQFVFSEAVEIVGVPAKTLNNWTQRGVVDIGLMHRTGRRMYSIVDLAQLAVVSELSMLAETKPHLAGAVALWARDRMSARMERDASGKLKWKGNKASPRAFLKVWFKDGEHTIEMYEGNDWFTNHSLRHTFIVVPLDDVITRVQIKSFDVLEREWKKRTAEADDEED